MPNSAVSTFADPYQFQSAVRASDVEVYLPNAGPYRAELTKIDLQRLWMQRGFQSLPYLARGSLHKDRAAIFFIADADPRIIRISGSGMGRDHINALPLESEFYQLAPPAMHWAAMSLASADLARVGRALVGRELSAPSVSRLIRPASAQLARLRNVHQAAGELAATAPDILARPEVARAMEDALLRAMVSCLQAPEEAVAVPFGRPRVPVMRRFEEALREQPDQPVYLTGIRAKIGVSGRTLRLHCQEHLGMSPHRYLWLRRMHLVRQAFIRGDATSVTTAAMDHGFAELGRFSMEYHRLFGEAPSATFRANRGDRSA